MGKNKQQALLDLQQLRLYILRYVDKRTAADVVSMFEDLINLVNGLPD